MEGPATWSRAESERRGRRHRRYEGAGEGQGEELAGKAKQAVGKAKQNSIPIQAWTTPERQAQRARQARLACRARCFRLRRLAAARP